MIEASCGMGKLMKVSLASHKRWTLKVWVRSLYAYSRLEHLDDMADVVTHIKMVTIHIKQKLGTCIDPLDYVAYLSGAVKLASG